MSPWDTLGIEPTDDIRAIKKAYSVKLKTTRPDDDAQAYQALREAYEAAQQWAPFVANGAMEAELQEAVPEGEHAESPPVDSTAPMEPVPEEETPESPELAQGPTVERLLQTCAAILEQGGAQHLVRMWPGLQKQLEDLPIAAQFAASHGFAGFVLEHNDVPVPVLVALTQHFQWGLDYRADQQLGPGLSVPLQEKLQQAHVYAALLGGTGPADVWPMALARMWTVQRKLWAGWFATLLDPIRSEEARQVPVARLVALGVASEAATAAVRLLGLGRLVQLAMLAALLLACVAGARVLGDGYRSWADIGAATYLLVFYLGLYALGYRVVAFMEAWCRYVRDWLPAHPWLPEGLALVPLVLALLGYLDTSFLWFGGRMASQEALFLLMILYGLIWALVPTEVQPWRSLFLPMCVILAFGVRGLFPSLNDVSVIGMAFGWVLLAHGVLTRYGSLFEAVHQEVLTLRFMVRVPLLFLGIKAVLVVWALFALLCLPVLVFRMVAQRGPLYVYLALLAAAALNFTVTYFNPGLWFPAWLLAAVIAIQLLQTGGQALADYCLRKLRSAQDSAL